jgi:hypothetical protein
MRVQMGINCDHASLAFWFDLATNVGYHGAQLTTACFVCEVNCRCYYWLW